MRIALFEPDIPQNAGTMLRLAACLGLEAEVIEPAGSPVGDHAFRRAGMDYLDEVVLVRHPSWQDFEDCAAPAASGFCCSPPGPRSRISTTVTATTTSCCSAANRRAFPPMSTTPPTPG